MAFLHWQIGAVRVTRVAELVAPVPAKALLEIEAEAMRPHEAWLRPHFLDDEGNLLLSIHALIVESQGRRILVDTCVGEHQVPGMEILSTAENSFLGDLELAGFPRDSIDTVLCTHLHFDHVGWNTMKVDGKWVPTFPSARYLFARKEWEHWQKEESPFAPTLGDAVQPVIDAGLSDLIEMDHRLTEEVSLEATPGHTPGHVSVRIESGGDRALITGDMTHHPVQWAEPAWRMNADSDSAEAEATRRRIAAELVDGPVLVIGTHYAEPCAGHIVSAEGGPPEGGHRFAARTDAG